MASSNLSGPTPNLPSIQILRGVAALMVAYYHLLGQFPTFAERLWPAEISTAAVLAHGVDIFFIISGFIMMISSRQMHPVDFAARRLIRIVPLYWFFTIFLATVAIAKPGLVRSAIVTPESLWKSLAFVPFFNPAVEGQVWPLLIPGWTLNYEMLFYGIFACALCVGLRFRIWLCALVFMLLVSMRLIPGYERSAAMLSYSSPILFEFIGGMLIGHLYWTEWTPPRPACLAMIAGGFVLLFTQLLHVPDQAPIALVVAGVPSFLIVLGAVMFDKTSASASRVRSALAVGEASYSIYLSHIFVLGAMRAIWSAASMPLDTMWSAVAFAVASLGAIVLGGILSQRLIEKPTLRYGQRVWSRIWKKKLGARPEGQTHADVSPGP